MTKLHTYRVKYTVEAQIEFNPLDFDLEGDTPDDLETVIKDGIEIDGIQPYLNDDKDIISSTCELTFISSTEAEDESEDEDESESEGEPKKEA